VEPETAPAEVWRPDVTVATVVERNGSYLFVEERVRGALVVNQPAGHLEPDESLVQAAVRETLEETAWEVELTGLVAVYQWMNPADQGQVLRFTFAAVPLRQRPGQALDQGIVRALWLTPEELRAGNFPPRSPLVWKSIEDHAQRRPLPLDALCSVEPAASPNGVPA